MKRVGRYWLPDSDDHFERWLKRGEYQAAPRQMAVKATPRRRRAVDVGAHVGTWTVPLAGNFAAVEAFEPDPDNAECLRAVAPSNVRCWPLALGRSEGAGKLVELAPGNTGMVAVDTTGAGTVSVVTLDAFAWDDVDLLKLDVERGELDVLAGARQTIERCSPVIVTEDLDGDVADLLTDWGYKVHAISGSNVVLVR